MTFRIGERVGCIRQAQHTFLNYFLDARRYAAAVETEEESEQLRSLDFGIVVEKYVVPVQLTSIAVCPPEVFVVHHRCDYVFPRGSHDKSLASIGTRR